MEFTLNYHLHIDVKDRSYFEILWMYERLVKELNPKQHSNLPGIING
jgi:hypothetical protein